ncbi:MAG: RNA methyltransferase [Vicingaceae bacterium]|nr:RNA methyltransferase [Vicingaceae bacterium]
MEFTNNRKKFIKSLQLKKNRVAHGLFLVEGDKLFQELIQSTFEIEEVYATKTWLTSNQDFISNKPYAVVSEKELASISSFKTPQEVIALVKQEKSRLSTNYQQPIVALDNIQDPGNLGTIIRTMDWFGFENLVCSPTCVELYNPKVVQASMGSIFRINTSYQELSPFLSHHQQFSIYGAVLDGKNCFKNKLQKKNTILLMGNESNGISKDLYPFISHKITIPKFGRAESLNVAIATSIFCAEFVK